MKKSNKTTQEPKDAIDVFDDLFVRLFGYLFKFMAFCLVGVMLLTGIKEGWQKITGDKPVATQSSNKPKIANPVNKTKVTP